MCIDELASLFQTISLSDYLFFSKLPDGATQDVLHCTDPTLTVDGNNLVLKALDLMRRKTGLRTFLDVKLQKHVPIQAGLGGGSGNAATAMQAFNMLCGYPGMLLLQLETKSVHTTIANTTYITTLFYY